MLGGASSQLIELDKRNYMSKKKQASDPYADREAAQYDNPIASREHILELVDQIPSCTFNRLLKHLAYKDEFRQEALRRRVIAMLRDNQLLEGEHNTLTVLRKENLHRGKVLVHKDGYGFFVPDAGGEDWFLSYHEVKKVFDGDEVLACILPHQHKGKTHAQIIEVVQHNTEKVVGKLLIDGKNRRVVPVNPKIQHTIFLEKDASVIANHEELVVVEITQQPSGRGAVKGIVIKVLGQPDEPGIELEIALHQFGIPHIWPEQVLKEAKAFAEQPSEKDKQNRVNLCHLPFVTIDGEDAKDFDDALYCEKKKSGGWRLWVAIADVSHYVRLNTALDQEAQNRATSVYFPDYVVPMLPEALSNGLCSLMPNVERLALVCELTISARGRLSGFEFYQAVIQSHARLTYAEVWQMLQQQEDVDSVIRDQYAHLVKHIDELYNLYHALRAQRVVRGALDFDTVEAKPIFDENRQIESFMPIQRNDAHKIIEECMLSANVAAAKLMGSLELPMLYRVHEGPTEKKLKAFREFIGELGLSLGGGMEPSPRDYQEFTELIKDRDDAELLQTMLLRSMSQAVYQPENNGHFGLAYQQYTHFTSPIRRYPDLLLHRAIHYAINSVVNNKHLRVADAKKLERKKTPFAYSMEHMIQLGEQCSIAERRAEDASRDVMASLKAKFLQQYIGQTFSGTISAVVAFGFFVELDDLYSEGLVHVSEIDDDYYQFDNKQRLVGERSRKVFRLGDKVEVKITQVEVDERKVHLQLLEQLSSRGKALKAKAGKTKKSSHTEKAGKDRKHKKSIKTS